MPRVNGCHYLEVDTPEAMSAKVHLGLQTVGMAPDAEGPYLLHLLGVQAGADRLAGLTPEAIKAGSFTASASCCSTPANSSPWCWRWRMSTGSTRPRPSGSRHTSEMTFWLSRAEAELA